MNEIIDIGCGSSKYPGSYGIDIFPYPGVDKVINLDQTPWDIPSNSFSGIRSIHVIEHVDNLVNYMKEIHRIAKPGAAVTIVTPHFSSYNSWADPTHKRHMSSNWYELFISGYLVPQTGQFELIKSEVFFGKSIRNIIGKWLVKLRGLHRWEKNYAFTYPGMDVQTVLKVIK